MSAALPLVPPYRESGRELSRAGLYAVGVHLACVLLLAIGLYSAPPPPFEPVGEPIEAELISLPTQLKPAPPRPQPRPQPPRPVTPPPSAPKPETTPASRPEDVTDLKPPAPPVAEPDPLVTGPDPAVERRRREEEQRRQQLEQVRAERERLQEQQRKEEQRLAELREQQLQRELAQREQAERARREAQIAEEAAALRGTRQSDDLRAQYVTALAMQLDAAWLRPMDSLQEIQCNVLVRQIRGGEVIGRSIIEPCRADMVLRNSMLTAVDRASPLPYDGFESVFSAEIIVPMNTSGL
ncbi:MAG: trichohyalin-plectin-homology domain domain-containing protein [Xanthomonadales bacterium]|jgi:colicin import membrane protein|nr:trichohyalin-plectin-homology domain domain-containing protein [Xanthomonadales bacterium]